MQITSGTLKDLKYNPEKDKWEMKLVFPGESSVDIRKIRMMRSLKDLVLDITSPTLSGYLNGDGNHGDKTPIEAAIAAAEAPTWSIWEVFADGSQAGVFEDGFTAQEDADARAEQLREENIEGRSFLVCADGPATPAGETFEVWSLPAGGRSPVKYGGPFATEEDAQARINAMSASGVFACEFELRHIPAPEPEAALAPGYHVYGAGPDDDATRHVAGPFETEYLADAHITELMDKDPDTDIYYAVEYEEPREANAPEAEAAPAAVPGQTNPFIEDPGQAAGSAQAEVTTIERKRTRKPKGRQVEAPAGSVDPVGAEA